MFVQKIINHSMKYKMVVKFNVSKFLYQLFKPQMTMNRS